MILNFYNKMGDKIFTTSMKTFNVLELMEYTQIKGQTMRVILIIIQNGLLFQAHILILDKGGIFKEKENAICYSPKLYFCFKMYLIFHIWCKWLPQALTNGCVKKVRSAVQYVIVIPSQKRLESCNGT